MSSSAKGSTGAEIQLTNIWMDFSRGGHYYVIGRENSSTWIIQLRCSVPTHGLEHYPNDLKLGVCLCRKETMERLSSSVGRSSIPPPHDVESATRIRISASDRIDCTFVSYEDHPQRGVRRLKVKPQGLLPKSGDMSWLLVLDIPGRAGSRILHPSLTPFTQ